MGGKPGDKISSERFYKALSVRGMSLNKLGAIAEEQEIITKRNIQRNLRKEEMNHSILIKLCKIIDVSPEFITDTYRWTDANDLNDCVPSFEHFSATKDYKIYKNLVIAMLIEMGEKMDEPIIANKSLPYFENNFEKIEESIRHAVIDFIEKDGAKHGKHKEKR